MQRQHPVPTRSSHLPVTIAAIVSSHCVASTEPSGDWEGKVLEAPLLLAPGEVTAFLPERWEALCPRTWLLLKIKALLRGVALLTVCHKFLKGQTSLHEPAGLRGMGEHGKEHAGKTNGALDSIMRKKK